MLRAKIFRLPALPESFKVLYKELQALGLDTRLYDKDGNEVELKQDIDDGTEIQPIDSNAFTEVNDFDSNSEGYTLEDADEKAEEAGQDSEFDDMFTDSDIDEDEE